VKDSPIRGIATALPRRLTTSPAKLALKQTRASTPLGDQVKLATQGAKYKPRGPRAHRGPGPTILELRRAAEKQAGR
jgi:hypothetical protein